MAASSASHTHARSNVTSTQSVSTTVGQCLHYLGRFEHGCHNLRCQILRSTSPLVCVNLIMTSASPLISCPHICGREPSLSILSLLKHVSAVLAGITQQHWEQLATGTLKQVLETPAGDPARACSLIFDEMHCQVRILLAWPDDLARSVLECRTSSSAITLKISSPAARHNVIPKMGRVMSMGLLLLSSLVTTTKTPITTSAATGIIEIPSLFHLLLHERCTLLLFTLLSAGARSQFPQAGLWYDGGRNLVGFGDEYDAAIAGADAQQPLADKVLMFYVRGVGCGQSWAAPLAWYTFSCGSVARLSR